MRNLTEDFKRVPKRRRYRRFESPALHVNDKNVYLNVDAREWEGIGGINWYMNDDDVVLLEVVRDPDDFDQDTYQFRKSGIVSMPKYIRELLGVLDIEETVFFKLKPHDRGWTFCDDYRIEDTSYGG